MIDGRSGSTTPAMTIGDQSPPKDFEGFKALLVQNEPQMPKRLKQVAAFALDHLDEIAFGTAASVAAQAQVQPSTLVRFAQALGYSGFSELQAVFQTRLRERWPDYRERLDAVQQDARAKAGVAGLVDGFAEAAMTSLRQLRERLEPAALEQAAKVLAQADTIYLIGQRRSFPIVAYLAYAFGKLGLRHMLMDGVGGLGPEQVACATESDAVLAISFNPYSPSTVELTARLFQRGVPVVAMTDSALSPLAKNATTWIEVAEADYAAFRSMSASLSVGMALAVAVAERRAAIRRKGRG